MALSHKEPLVRLWNLSPANGGGTFHNVLTAIDREFEFYDFFSFLKFNEFYEFFLGWKKFAKNS